MEFAGSLGDLGTLLPIAAAMVLINGLDPVGMFFSIGLYYILAGLFFGVTVPIQPMKVIGAYAIGSRAVLKGLMMALLEPRDALLKFDAEGNAFGRLALLEQLRLKQAMF